MTLSAPIFHLKRRAKALSRKEGIPLTKAQDLIANQEGYSSWSFLVTQAASRPITDNILCQLFPGDLVLFGARPGHGKTMKSLELLVEALNCGKRGMFFTLEYNTKDLVKLLQRIVDNPTDIFSRIEFDNSDFIHADYIISQVKTTPPGSVIVIDYLQLLDQNRNHPNILDQVRSLKIFAKKQKVIVVLISQIDRSFELSDRQCPGIDDVRLSNPLDLKMFDKTYFIHNGEERFEAVS